MAGWVFLKEEQWRRGRKSRTETPIEYSPVVMVVKRRIGIKTD
jgi:hypothetical protein